MRTKSCTLCGSRLAVLVVRTELGPRSRCFDCRLMTLRFTAVLRAKLRHRKTVGEKRC